MAILVGKKYSFGSRYFEGFAPSIYVDPRWYWTLNGASYGAVPEMEFAGDFSITMGYQGGTGRYSYFLGNEDDASSWVRVESSLGSLSVRSSLGIRVYGVTPINDGIYHTISATRVGNTLSLYVDGNFESSETVTDNDSFSCKNLGSFGSAYFVTGVITNFKAIGITNTDVYPSGTAYYKLDEPWSDDHIAVDSDNADGVNLYDYEFPQVLPYTNQYISMLEPTGSVVVGGAYIAEITVSYMPVGGRIKFIMGSNYFINITSAGTYYGYVSSINDAQVLLQEGSNGLTGGAVVESVYLKQTTSMQKYNDLEPDYIKGLS